jgi:hypothetical protein
MDGGNLVQWETAVGQQAQRAKKKGERRAPLSRARAIAEVNAARRVLGMKIKRSKAGPGDRRKLRGAAISKLMKQEGMSLEDASRYLSAHPELVR